MAKLARKRVVPKLKKKSPVPQPHKLDVRLRRLEKQIVEQQEELQDLRNIVEEMRVTVGGPKIQSLLDRVDEVEEDEDVDLELPNEDDEDTPA